jgi:hypothetical protein
MMIVDEPFGGLARHESPFQPLSFLVLSKHLLEYQDVFLTLFAMLQELVLSRNTSMTRLFRLVFMHRESEDEGYVEGTSYSLGTR